VPACQVQGVERDVGPVVGRIRGRGVGGSVEGVQAGGAVVVGGEGFALRGGTRSSHPHPNHSPQRLDICRGIRPRDAGG
jgi:hypothetical protein